MRGYLSKSIKMSALLKRLFVCVFLVSVSFPVLAGDIIKIGVDHCTSPLMERLAEVFGKKTGTYFRLIPGLCPSWVKKVEEGEVDVGVTTQFVTDVPEGCSNVVIAKAPIALIVNKKNKVKNLSFKQLQGIFSGEITNWKEVGGKNLPIKLVMLQACVTDTLSKQVGLYGAELEARKIFPFVRVNSVADTNKIVEEDEATLGQIIYGYASTKVRILKIDGYLPSESNFLSSNYRLYEDYNLIVVGEPSGKVKEFIDFALSPEGQNILVSMKHIPIKRSP